ncbi:MAG: hypothetical protein ACK5L0_02260 [Candidatus Fimivivens sp.]
MKKLLPALLIVIIFVGCGGAHIDSGSVADTVGSATYSASALYGGVVIGGNAGTSALTHEKRLEIFNLRAKLSGNYAAENNRYDNAIRTAIETLGYSRQVYEDRNTYYRFKDEKRPYITDEARAIMFGYGIDADEFDNCGLTPDAYVYKSCKIFEDDTTYLGVEVNINDDEKMFITAREFDKNGIDMLRSDSFYYDMAGNDGYSMKNKTKKIQESLYPDYESEIDAALDSALLTMESDIHFINSRTPDLSAANSEK